MSKRRPPHSIIPAIAAHRPLNHVHSPLLHRTFLTTPHPCADPSSRPVIDARSLAAEPPPATAPRFTIRRKLTDNPRARSLAAEPLPATPSRFTIRRELNNDPREAANKTSSTPSTSLWSSSPTPAPSFRNNRPAVDDGARPRFSRRINDTRSTDPSSRLTRSPGRNRLDRKKKNNSRFDKNKSSAGVDTSARDEFLAQRKAYEEERAALLARKPELYEPAAFTPTLSSGPQILTGVEGMKDMWAAEVAGLNWILHKEGHGWEDRAGKMGIHEKGGRGWTSERQRVAARKVAWGARAGVRVLRKAKGGRDVLGRLYSGRYLRQRPDLRKGAGGKGLGHVIGRVVERNTSYEVRDERRIVGKVEEFVVPPRRDATRESKATV